MNEKWSGPWYSIEEIRQIEARDNEPASSSTWWAIGLLLVLCAVFLVVFGVTLR